MTLGSTTFFSESMNSLHVNTKRNGELLPKLMDGVCGVCHSSVMGRVGESLTQFVLKSREETNVLWAIHTCP